MPFLTLGIETSCDETAASVLAGDREIRSSVTASQIVHSQYGGVVPELASRAHIRLIVPVVQTALGVAGAALEDLNLIAATYAPGLLGALLVGLPFAKALAWSRGLPFIGVNHLEGHIFAIFLQYPEIPLPFIALIVSGGHTELILVLDRCRYRTLGATLDDACGEAYDKAAKMLGFPYPGGAHIEQQARKGRRTIKFPLPRVPGLDFSFSGLKTSLLYYLRDHGQPVGAGSHLALADICHSFQEILIDALWAKIKAAGEQTGIKRLAVTGGVAVNGRLRERFPAAYFPAPELCADNAAMIAACGYERFRRFGPSSFSLAARAREALFPGDTTPSSVPARRSHPG
jgi:N6-L-threonylcarbamoyladenine synthase